MAPGPVGRSLQHLIDTVTALQDQGVGFRSVTESIDTTTAGGRLVFHLFGALAEFGGRPRTMTDAKLRLGRAMRA